MTDNFFIALRQLEGTLDPGYLAEADGPTTRDELSRALAAVGVTSRRLLDDLRNHPPAAVGVLYDGYEEWEERAWVPTSMAATPRQARRAIPAAAREFVCAEPGLYLHVDRKARTYLAPGEFVNGDDTWSYSPCRKGAPGAVEFWVVEIAERRFSLRRGISKIKGGTRAYRGMRRNGYGRWRSTEPLRFDFSPWRRIKIRWRRRVTERRHRERPFALWGHRG